MTVISRQELQSNGKWWTWINYIDFNTFIYVSSYPITENEAIVLKDDYLDVHQYDTISQIIISIYDNAEQIRNAIAFIKINDPNLTQWNAYLASLAWDDALAVRWFFAILAKGLADRKEIDLTVFTEVEVLSKLKTWIINTAVRRLEKILFG